MYVIILLHHRCSFWVPIYHYRHHHQVKTDVRFACGVLLLKASLVWLFSCIVYVAHLNYLKNDTYMHMNILFLTLIFVWLFGYYIYNIIQYFVACASFYFIFSTLVAWKGSILLGWILHTSHILLHERNILDCEYEWATGATTAPPHITYFLMWCTFVSKLFWDSCSASELHTNGKITCRYLEKLLMMMTMMMNISLWGNATKKSSLK